MSIKSVSVPKTSIETNDNKEVYMTDQSIEDASRNSIIEDAKTAGFELTDDIKYYAANIEQLTKFAQLREARQSSQSEPVAETLYTWDYKIDGEPDNIYTTEPMTNEQFRVFNIDKLIHYERNAPVAAPQQAIPSGWISVEDRLPDVPKGECRHFNVAIVRQHDNKSYAVPAVYLNQMELTNAHSYDDEIYTGWHEAKEHYEFEEYYSKLETAGDKVTHWQPLPAPPKATPDNLLGDKDD
jgi:hypothetical protein